MPIVSADPNAVLVANRPATRVLRWVFSRREEVIVFQLGLTADNSAYELRIDPPWHPVGVTTEVFDDATSAIQRHAVIERMLVNDGWLLEEFESEQNLP